VSGRERVLARAWCRLAQLQYADIEDITQIVLIQLADKMRTFCTSGAIPRISDKPLGHIALVCRERSAQDPLPASVTSIAVWDRRATAE
jgi:hypothetical protein